MYKTVVIEYSPKADNMAQKVEEKITKAKSSESALSVATGTVKAK